MNVRIAEYAKQAGFYVTYIGDPTGTNYDLIEKFAKLIVQECASRVDHILREKSKGGGTYGNEIKEHFGVEE